MPRKTKKPKIASPWIKEAARSIGYNARTRTRVILDNNGRGPVLLLELRNADEPNC